MNSQFPCFNCLKLPICRSHLLGIKIKAPTTTLNYQEALGIYIRRMSHKCIDLFEFLYCKTVMLKNVNTQQDELHAAVDLCRVDVVRDYYFNY